MALDDSVYEICFKKHCDIEISSTIVSAIPQKGKQSSEEFVQIYPHGFLQKKKSLDTFWEFFRT